MEREILTKIKERLLKSFMDMLILAELMNRDNMTGYDVIDYIHEEFDFLISSGTVYSLLYSIERDGLIKGEWMERKRVYSITNEGKKAIKTIQNASRNIQNFIAKILQAK